MLMAAMALWSGVQGSRGGVADFAHLGGFVGGWLYLKWLDRTRGHEEVSHRRRSRRSARTTLANYKRIDPKSIHDVNRDEVNRILDKISAKRTRQPHGRRRSCSCRTSFRRTIEFRR